MHPKMHEEIDKIVFGRAFPNVHKWIDGCFNGKNGRTHWIHRHHEKGIHDYFCSCGSEVLRRVAKLHVMVDWMWYHAVLCLPKNSDDVKRLLKEHGVFTDNERPCK